MSMELELIRRVYFIGAGGIGMSALARYFKKRGCQVAGYDKTKTALTTALEEEGIQLSYADQVEPLPNEFLSPGPETLIVYTPAIPKDSALLNFFRNGNFELQKRSQVLGIISRGQRCIAVAGTHGKTTTSAVIAHILTHSGYGCTAFLGGIATNYHSNFLIGDNDVVVVEADEYDRSFLTLHPDIAVVTAMDADHLDIYGDVSDLEDAFRLFAGQLKAGGTLLVRNGLPLQGGKYYSADEDSAVQATRIRVEQGTFIFDYTDDQRTIRDIPLLLPGRHNVENVTAAMAASLQLGIPAEKVKAAVACFAGVKRRFEYIVRTSAHVYIDDYAHHPEELRACFEAVRELYPGKKLTVVFQPHLFSRTRDFADEFAAVLSTADELLLLDIYPARELPVPGIDSAFLQAKMSLENSRVLGKEEVLSAIREELPELLLTVGAGDIDTLIQPLKELLTNV